MNWHARRGWLKAILRPALTAALLGVSAGLLAGCLYPGEHRQERGVSYVESVDRIQSAVDRFQDDQAILPIITAGEETPRYEKFRIDLDMLHKQGYLDEIPDTAFEKGGRAYFLLINEEQDPAVKVMDLMTAQKVNDVQRMVDKYRNSHDGKLPVTKQEETYPGLYTVDLKQAGAEAYSLKSVYSGQTQDYLVDETGRVFADYAFDIMQALDKSGTTPRDNKDLREVLTEQSYFVPVKSLPYRWIGGTPVAWLE
ncbi:uncharacterized protein DUF3939 [Fontibacillus phaseoli]|uniref:Uncharacterized protein DUF3939 n=1 Tax=Fontibacillus phaseoli TaxID=1416533 RepID=A0A369BS41_9BACL|nr:DUF3939 domain-containing protein [Fontibacillus phaseoli]RCX23247.1 uncharacterized protein DUF3939 [Fontibacillus phaseoli]